MPTAISAVAKADQIGAALRRHAHDDIRRDGVLLCGCGTERAPDAFEHRLDAGMGGGWRRIVARVLVPISDRRAAAPDGLSRCSAAPCWFRQYL